MLDKFFKGDISKGIAFLKDRQYKEAKDYFALLALNQGQNPEIWFNLAKACHHLRQFPEVKEHLLECVRHKPKEEIVRGILEITNWPMISSHKFVNYGAVWSQDGVWLAYPSAREDTDGDGKLTQTDRAGLYIYDLARATEWQILASSSHNSFPAFSPEGRRLLYCSARRDTDGDGKLTSRDQGALYLSDLDNGEERLLVSDEHRVKFPFFTPDGNSIIFCGWRKGGANSGIYQLDLKSGTEKLLVSDFYENTFPSVARDGERLLFSSWREDTNKDGRIDLQDNSAIYLLDLVRGGEKILAGSQWSHSYPVFSPDGKWVACLSRQRDTNGDGKMDSLDNSAIMLLELGSGRQEMLVDDQRYNKFPAFTHDGTSVVYIGNWRREQAPGEEVRDYFENKGVYSVEIKTKKIRQIMNEKYYGCRFLSVSPAGPHAAYLSWRKDTGRGLYVADYERLPDSEQLARIIQENL